MALACWQNRAFMDSRQHIRKETTLEVIHFNQRQLAARRDISEATLERWRNMYLGGPLPTQLLRVTPQLVDLSGATLTLLDPKGRNRHANPPRHVLPIREDLMPVVRRRLAQTSRPCWPRKNSNAGRFQGRGQRESRT